MKRYTMPGLYAAFCLFWAGVITCVVLHEDVGGRWPWMLSVCAALLFTLLLLLVWLWRLGCGLYRWHPAVREVLFLLVAVMLCCWGFRGFTPIIWYKLDVSCCSGVGTTPPGMYRPCNGRICRYSMTGAPVALVIGWWPIASNFKAILGAAAAACRRSDISIFTDSSRIGLSSVSRAASAMAAPWPVSAAKAEN